MQERGFVGVRHGAHGEAAGDVDRGPKVGDSVIQAGDAGFLGEVAAWHQRNIVVVRETRGLRVRDIWDPAMRAGGDQGADDGTAQCTVPPVTITVRLSKSMCVPRNRRAAGATDPARL